MDVPDPTFPLNAAFFFLLLLLFFLRFWRSLEQWHRGTSWPSRWAMDGKRWGIRIAQRARINTTRTAAFTFTSRRHSLVGIAYWDSVLYLISPFPLKHTFSLTYGFELLLNRISTKFCPPFSVHCPMGKTYRTVPCIPWSIASLSAKSQ